MFNSPEYLYQEIAEAIRQRIASGELEAGERLPAVRALAQDWSCTPGTVNRAYKILAEDGLVISYRGKGTLVAENVLSPGRKPKKRPSNSRLRWMSLVNRAEQYLLDAAKSGYTVDEAQAALNVALARWRATGEPKDEALRGLQLAENVLRFAGSHDLFIESMTSLLLEAESPVTLELSFVGSLGGLMALLRGDADLAGSHLWDRESDTYNKAYVERLFPDEEIVLLTLAHRRLGLLYKAERVGAVDTPGVIAARNLRLMNRQRGSGTRMWLDSQFHQLGIDTGRVRGYESEATTHSTVAKAVASGEADIGPGIHAAASAYGLDFTVLARERYDLVFRKSTSSMAPLSALVQLVQSDAFRKTVSAMSGYDADETGRMSVVGR